MMTIIVIWIDVASGISVDNLGKVRSRRVSSQAGFFGGWVASGSSGPASAAGLLPSRIVDGFQDFALRRRVLPHHIHAFLEFVPLKKPSSNLTGSSARVRKL